MLARGALFLAALLCLAGAAMAATCPPEEGAGAWTPPSDASPILTAPGTLFSSGTPVTNPYASCGGCYAWSSTYYNSPTNYDLTARRFTVPAGSVVTSIRTWWAYGVSGPHPNSANNGGTAADFAGGTSISFDLYLPDGPAGAPGTLVQNLTGTWVVLDAATNYRELLLDAPCALAGTDYFLSLRAVTPQVNNNATVLWLACAPSDLHMDWEDYQNGVNAPPSTGGWKTYATVPGSPCPQDFNFGLQVLGLPAGSNDVDVVPPGPCISVGTPCVTVPFVFNRTDADAYRMVDVTFHLSSNLKLCTPYPGSITAATGVGSWADGYTNAAMATADNGSKSYTATVYLQGAPCGPTHGGALFSVAVTNDGATTGTGTITVDVVHVRGCLNEPRSGAPGAAGSITIDVTNPAAIANLAAAQDKTANGADGRTDINLSWSGVAPGDQVHLYRKAFGAYPEYDDAGGAPPAAPGAMPPAGWTWVATLSGPGSYADQPPARDFWYYTAYVQEPCGNVSAASNITAGTLDYHLGDVSTGVLNCVGDNLVALADISLLGAHYGVPVPAGFECLDVGPTTDYSVDARPTTDNMVDFEDLMMFAINYGQVSLAPPAPSGVAGSRTGRLPHLSLSIDAPRFGRPADPWTARLRLDQEGLVVKGVHAVLGFDPERVEVLVVSQGTLLQHQSAPVFFRAPREPGALTLDASALGSDVAIEGSGEVATVLFRPLAAGAAPALVTADLRDRWNRRPGDVRDAAAARPLAAPSTTVAFALEPARPNPFGGATEICFRLPEAVTTSLVIFDASGRRVRSLVDGPLPAGERRVTWDGRDDRGHTAGIGVYLVRLVAGGSEASQKLYRYR